MRLLESMLINKRTEEFCNQHLAKEMREKETTQGYVLFLRQIFKKEGEEHVLTFLKSWVFLIV